MKTSTTLLLLIAFLVCYGAAPSLADNDADQVLTKQVQEILTECKKITTGTTRADLMKVFTTEGGLSTAKRRTFVHHRCPYIKVDLEFTMSDPNQAVLEERPTDTICRISKPYLDWAIRD